MDASRMGTVALDIFWMSPNGMIGDTWQQFIARLRAYLWADTYRRKCMLLIHCDQEIFESRNVFTRKRIQYTTDIKIRNPSGRCHQDAIDKKESFDERRNERFSNR